MKTIEIKCEGSRSVPLKELVVIQGNLKDLSKQNYDKLRESILKRGFCAPIFVWRDEDMMQTKVLDGTQRIRVLTEMQRAEGYTIPDVPVVDIFATTEHEAKDKLLAFVSQYGELTSGGLFEFASTNNIDLPTLEGFRFPEIDMDSFKAEFFDMPLDFKEPEDKKAPEEKGFEAKSCPNCGVLLEGE